MVVVAAKVDVQPVVPSSNDGLTMLAYPVAGLHCTLVCVEEMVNERAPGTNELATSARAVRDPFAMLAFPRVENNESFAMRVKMRSISIQNERLGLYRPIYKNPRI